MGANRDEGSYFMVYGQGNENTPGNGMPNVDYETFVEHLRHYFNYIPSYPHKTPPMVFQSLIQQYTDWSNWSNKVQNAVILNHALGDTHFTCPTITIANIYAMEKLPVYFYHFVARPSTNDWPSWMGVMHG